MIIRRAYSVPEHIAMFGVPAALAGRIYPMIMAHTGGQGLPCPLRTLTGVPCPFCGMTTATVALTHGQWQTAALTSPLAYLVAVLVVATVPVLVARSVRAAPLPRRWPATALTRTRWIVGGVVACSWIFQLHRFGFW